MICLPDVPRSYFLQLMQEQQCSKIINLNYKKQIFFLVFFLVLLAWEGGWTLTLSDLGLLTLSRCCPPPAGPC